MSGAVFEFTTDRYAGGELSVVSFRGREEISRSFCFEILLTGAGVDAAALARDLLTKPAHLTMSGDGGRTVHGVVRRVEAEGVSGGGDDRHHYRVWLVPHLWMLGKGKNSRIFQDMTVRDVVDRVLGESSIARRWSLLGAYQPRVYCVQHQESDLAFIRRILAEEGIFYWFEHPDGEREAEVVVLSDSAHFCGPIAGASTLAFRDSGGMVEREQDVRGFRSGGKVRPRSTLLKEFDFNRPSMPLVAGAGPGAAAIADALGSLVGAASSPLAGAAAALFDAATPAAPPGLEPVAGALQAGASRLRSALPPGSSLLRVYDHHGEFDGVAVNPDRAELHLEQRRAGAATIEGDSRCKRLLPGKWFELQGAPIGAHDGRFTVTRVEHEGHQPESIRASAGGSATKDVYKNSFHGVPSDIAPRPPRPRRKLQQTLETATVVGPAGEEIYTDPLGRIKVQFHWDLQGRNDESSSCWMRTMQGWAGTGWGFQFVPRVGMEVMVMFVCGDIDRPVVIGCLYNGTHPTPHALPVNATRSGIRTRTTPRGQGGNEIMFEDRAGSEQVYIHAQRTFEEAVEREHVVRIGGDESVSIGGDRSSAIVGDEAESVRGRQSVQLGQSVVSVAGDATLHVGGERVERVGGASVSTVEGTRLDRTHGAALTAVERDYSLSVGGHHSVIVGTAERHSASALFVHGMHASTATGKLVLASDTSITLQCGSSSIEIGPEKIAIHAKNILVAAVDAVHVTGDGPALHLTKEAELSADTVKVISSGAAVVLDANATVKGGSVKLGSGSADRTKLTSDDPTAETKPFSVKVTDGYGNAYGDKTYHLLVEGKKVEGTTAGDGTVSHDVPKSASVADLTVWIDRYPTGRRLHWQLQLTEALDDASSARGAQHRLTNLGYFRGEPTGELDDPTRAAIRRFQQVEGLRATGQLDDATTSKLREVHGS